MQDEDIFQTARLINCAWFAGIVMSDYFAAILGLVRQGSSWAFNPFEEMRNADHSMFERGRGNSCSVEVSSSAVSSFGAGSCPSPNLSLGSDDWVAIAQFNCLYRWHGTTSRADEEWVAKMGEKFFPGKEVEQVGAACWCSRAASWR